MFQNQYIIQFSAVFVVFLIWFLSSFALRYIQYSISKIDETTNDEDASSKAQQERFRSAIAAERTLLDGFLLLSVGAALNCFGQGNRTAGDVLSLFIMFTLFFMTIFHHTGHSNLTFALWVLITFAFFAYYIVPFATKSNHLGYFNVAYPIIPVPE